jgi:type VI protein secretion system component Hcp
MQSIKPGGWNLGGSLLQPGQISQASRSVTLLRPADPLSLQIKSAFSAHSTVPQIVINTSKGKVTLTNATVTSFGTPARKHDPILGSLQNYEEITFNFQKITWTWTEGGIQ